MWWFFFLTDTWLPKNKSSSEAILHDTTEEKRTILKENRIGISSDQKNI